MVKCLVGDFILKTKIVILNDDFLFFALALCSCIFLSVLYIMLFLNIVFIYSIGVLDVIICCIVAVSRTQSHKYIPV